MDDAWNGLVCGPEGISGAWQKRVVQETASPLLRRALAWGQASEKEASLRVVECCRVAQMAHCEGVLRTRPGNLQTACLPMCRRMLSGGPKWVIVKELQEFLGFCVVCGPEGISGAWQKRFVQNRPPPCSEGHSSGKASGQASEKRPPHASSNAVGWP